MSWKRVGIYHDKRRTLPYLVRWYGELDLDTGKPRRYSKSFRTRAQAEEFKGLKMGEMKRTGRRDQAKGETMQKLIHDFVKTKRPSRRPATLKLYDYATKRLLAFFGPERAVSSIQPRDCEMFMASQVKWEKKDKPLSAWSRSQILRNVKAIFQAGVRWNIIAANPFEGCDKTKMVVQKWHHMKAAEYLRLLEQAPDLRWRVFYALAYTAGLRYGELFSLTWGNIDFERGVVKIENRRGTPTMPAFHVKDKEARTIPLPDHTQRLLLEWQGQAPEGVPYVLIPAKRYQRILKHWHKLGMVDGLWENRFMVNNIRRRFQVHAKRAGLKFDGKFSIHTFRKSYGQNQANAGVPIKTLQYLMGHSSERTTLEFYTQMDAGQAAFSATATERLLTEAANHLDTGWTRNPVPGAETNQQGNRAEGVNRA